MKFGSVQTKATIAAYLQVLIMLLMGLSILFSANTHSMALKDRREIITPIIGELLSEDSRCAGFDTNARLFGDLVISSQSDLNKLRDKECLNGSLIFSGASGVMDFTPTSSLVEIRGSLFIQDTALTQLSGFDSLHTINRGIDIRNNANLRSISGFANLTSIGAANEDGVIKDLDIRFNSSLESISGFNKLDEVRGNFRIHFNPSLMNLSGFDDLKVVAARFALNGNTSLNSINANTFNKLETAATILIAGNSALTSLPMFNGLVETIAVDIFANQLLTSIDGFNNLRRLSRARVSQRFDDREKGLLIESNHSLQTISGFASLTTLSDVFLRFNPQLTSVSGFESLFIVTQQLIVIENPKLQSIPLFPDLVRVQSLVLNDTNLVSITGFRKLFPQEVQFVSVNNSPSLNCSNPSPTFLPADFSAGNLIDCTLKP